MRHAVAMYVRQISRKRSDGSRVRYLQLAEKVRDPDTGTPRDRVFFHLGREDQLDKGQLQRLVKSLSRFLGADEQAQLTARFEGLGSDLEVERSLALGGSYVLDAIWRRLEIDKALRRLSKGREFEHDIERLLFAMVANRALCPRSKLGLERWVGRKVSIEGLDKVAVHTLYRAMDFLVEHGDELQRDVYFSVATLLNLEVDLLFFDTTSVSFQVEDPDDEGEGLRRYGHSKDKRPDLPQVVIGLAVTRGGIPVRCWVLPGNTADASLVDQVQQDLAGWRLNRVVWVLDRGFAGEKQRIALQRGGGHVIMGEKLRSGSQELARVIGAAGRYRKVRDNLEIKEVKSQPAGDGRRFVMVRNPEQVQRDQSKREANLARLENEIEALNERRRRSPRGHSKAVCALKTHRTLGRYVKELKSGVLRIDRAAVRREERLDGKYLLSTTDPSLSAEDIALGYKQLIDVERAFRTLKSDLDIRPVYHRLEERIRAHVLLCWLALLLVRVIERDSGKTWPQMRDELEDISLVVLRSKDGVAEVRSRLTQDQRTILKSLDLRAPKLARRIAA